MHKKFQKNQLFSEKLNFFNVMIVKESSIVNMKWDETIHQFPNNQKISDESSKGNCYEIQVN